MRISDVVLVRTRDSSLRLGREPWRGREFQLVILRRFVVTLRFSRSMKT